MLSIVGDFLSSRILDPLLNLDQALFLGFSLGKVQEGSTLQSVQTIALLFFSKTSIEL